VSEIVVVETEATWESSIREIVDNPGITMLVGSVDTGKTTLTRQLVNAGVNAEIPTAIIDADTGQSELGPPAAISMTIVEQPVESIRELKPRRMYFVGSTTPVQHMLPVVIGVKRLADEALARGVKLVVIDTSGLVSGMLGRTLKLYKIDLLSPQHVIGLQKKRELNHILSVVEKMSKIKLHRLKVPKEVQIKTPAFRAARRHSQFYDYFRSAGRHFLRLDDIVCWGTYFTTGHPVKWQHYPALERILKTRILHAEIVGNGMYIVVECRPQMAGIEALNEKYGSRQFTIVCGTDFTNLLVGLADGNGNTIDLGIIEAIDFKQKRIAVLTPAASVTPVRIVQFGSMRIRPDGLESGKIRPGAI